MRKEQNFRWEQLSLGTCYYPEHWDPGLWREDLQRMKELHAERCCGCGLCSYICPSRIEVSQNVMKAKAIVLQALKEGK